MIKRLFSAMLVLIASSVSVNATSAQDELWNEIAQGGHVILMRHALAPGNGDPDNFDVNDCSTQRNLSEQGRQQAERSGQLLRDHGVTAPVIYSSQWCRCAETADLLDLGDVTASSALNSFYETPSERDEKTRSAIALIVDRLSALEDHNPTLLFVTHQVNITALTGIFPGSGEMIITKFENGELNVIGQIE